MNLFAFFLPQFHPIPENDEWWGKGFTEWTHVKAARPLFRGHIQPVHPIGDHYYNLLEKDTVVWQTNLMKKYHIDGLIYYHYYFNGKLLLERPAKNLLRWKDIQQRFFFCWANHSWYKSAKHNKELLIVQEYGCENDWECHFKYLLDFFKDERYEKKDGKPILMVFDADFDEKNALFSYFNHRCLEEGFKGICLIESSSGGRNETDLLKQATPYTDYVFLREPSYTESFCISQEPLLRLRYKLHSRLTNMGVYRKPFILRGSKLIAEAQRRASLSNRLLHGIWFGWDNTPRHKQYGSIITPFEHNEFVGYMDTFSSDDFIFINAWNEWAEGMVMEPTVENGYKYLEWIKEWRESRMI